MFTALSPARFTNVGADRANLLHELGAAAHEPRGRPANFGAILVQPNALGHFLNVLLSETRVRAAFAFLRTLDTSVDTTLMFVVAHQFLAIKMVVEKSRMNWQMAYHPSKSNTQRKETLEKCALLSDTNRMTPGTSPVEPTPNKTVLMVSARTVLVWACFFVVVGPSECFCQEPEAIVGDELLSGFDLTSLEALALQYNPTLVQAGAQVQISRGKALQAGLLPNPAMGYAGEQIGAEGTPGEFQGLFIEQEIITGGKLRLSRAKYAQEAQQAQIQLLAQRYRVLYGVRVAFYNALAEQRRVELRRQLIANAEEVAKTINELVNVGQANQADLLQSQVRLQRSQANLRMVERQYQGSWEELTAIIGAPDIVLTRLEGSLEFTTDYTLNREVALNDLLRCSPELRVARAEVRRDQIGLRREMVEPIPNIAVRADTGYNFEAEDTVAGVEIGLEIPLFDRNQGTVFQAQAELSRAQAEVARLELVLRRRFAQVFTEYETAMLSAKIYGEELMPGAEKVYRLYFESFQQRRAAWPQVLDAQRDYYELVEEHLDYLLEARRAEAQLASYLLDGGLDQPPAPTPEGHRDATPKPR